MVGWSKRGERGEGKPDQKWEEEEGEKRKAGKSSQRMRTCLQLTWAQMRSTRVTTAGLHVCVCCVFDFFPDLIHLLNHNWSKEIIRNNLVTEPSVWIWACSFLNFIWHEALWNAAMFAGCSPGMCSHNVHLARSMFLQQGGPHFSKKACYIVCWEKFLEEEAWKKECVLQVLRCILDTVQVFVFF